MLINFLLNEDTGASIMGSACGLPASKSGLAYAEAAGAIDPIVEEANAKIMAFCEFRPDPLFEDDFLKYRHLPAGVRYDGLRQRAQQRPGRAAA